MDKRKRHAQSQARYRDRKKAQELACEQTIEALHSNLVKAEAEFTVATRRNERLRERISRLKDEFVEVRLELEPPSQQPAHVRRQAATGRIHKTLAPSIADPFRTRPSSTPRGFRHHVSLTAQAVDPSASILHGITSFRQGVAQKLGCEVHDICWEWLSGRHPALTRHQGIYSHGPSPGSLRKFACMRFLVITEISCLLEQLKRLMAARSDFRAHSVLPARVLETSPQQAEWWTKPQNMASPGLPQGGSNLQPQTNAHAQSGRTSVRLMLVPDGDEEESTASNCESPDRAPTACDLDDIEQSLHVVSEQYADAATEQACHFLDSSGTPHVAPGKLGAGLDGLASIAKLALRDVLKEHLPRMHPADAARVLKRLKALWDVRSLETRDRGSGLRSENAFAIILTSLYEEIATTLASVCQQRHVYSQPFSPADLDAAIAATQQELQDVNREWILVICLLQLDMPRLMFSRVRCLDVAAFGFLKYEELMMGLYKRLELSHDQKRSLAACLAAFRREVAAVNARQRALTQRLADLTSSSHALAEAAQQELRRPTAPGQPGEGGCLDMLQRLSLEHAAFHMSYSVQDLVCGEHASDTEGPCFRLGLAGASPEATAAAQDVLRGLRGILVERNELSLRWTSAMHSGLLSAEQAAFLSVAMMPLIPDLLRLAGMAETDVCCAHVFGKRAIADVEHA